MERAAPQPAEPNGPCGGWRFLVQGAPVRNHREFARVLREAFRDQLWDSMVTSRSKNADVGAGQGVDAITLVTTTSYDYPLFRQAITLVTTTSYYY